MKLLLSEGALIEGIGENDYTPFEEVHPLLIDHRVSRGYHLPVCQPPEVSYLLALSKLCLGSASLLSQCE